MTPIVAQSQQMRSIHAKRYNYSLFNFLEKITCQNSPSEYSRALQNQRLHTVESPMESNCQFDRASHLKLMMQTLFLERTNLVEKFLSLSLTSRQPATTNAA